jgi:hypothetical protein
VHHQLQELSQWCYHSFRSARSEPTQENTQVNTKWGEHSISDKEFETMLQQLLNLLCIRHL